MSKILNQIVLFYVSDILNVKEIMKSKIKSFIRDIWKRKKKNVFCPRLKFQFRFWDFIFHAYFVYNVYTSQNSSPIIFVRTKMFIAIILCIE